MSDNHNNSQDAPNKISRRLKIILAAAAVALVGYYVYIHTLEPAVERIKPDQSAGFQRPVIESIDEPPAAEITEPTFTYYAGRAAFELPASFSVPPPSIVFSLDDSGHNPSVVVAESLPTGSDRPDGELKMLDPFEIVSLKLEEEEDLSNQFGCPARLTIQADKLWTNEELLKKMIFAVTALEGLDRNARAFPWNPGLNQLTLENVDVQELNDFLTTDDQEEESEIPPYAEIDQPEILVLNLRLERTDVQLTFEYKRNLEEGQKDDQLFLNQIKTEFVALAKNFTARYQWTGKNEKPERGALATAYGYLKPPDPGQGSQPSIVVHPEYKLRHAAAPNRVVPAGLSLLISIKPDLTNADSTPPKNSTARTVGGLPGFEGSKFDSRFVAGQTIEPDNLHFVDFARSWSDYCEPGDHCRAPSYSMSMGYREFMVKDGQGLYDELAYFKGVWDIVLDSMHPVD